MSGKETVDNWIIYKYTLFSSFTIPLRNFNNGDWFTMPNFTLFEAFLVLGKSNCIEEHLEPISRLKCTWMRDERDIRREVEGVKRDQYREKSITLRIDSKPWSHTADSDIRWPCQHEDLQNHREIQVRKAQNEETKLSIHVLEGSVCVNGSTEEIY